MDLSTSSTPPKLSRRLMLKALAAFLGVPLVGGCTKTVTRYRQDGTPYTVEEDDWVNTLAAALLILLLIGLVAAAASSSDSSSSRARPRRRRNSRLVSAGLGDYELELDSLAFRWSIQGREPGVASSSPRTWEIYNDAGVRMASAQSGSLDRVVRPRVLDSSSLQAQLRSLGVAGLIDPLQVDILLDPSDSTRFVLLGVSQAGRNSNTGESTTHTIHGRRYRLWADSKNASESKISLIVQDAHGSL